ncbi:hypothetical protein WN51_08770 [Melipona quadrifasciata]|uniref:Uncharacterized protein n=1 Tax=Melipona quadrifasciata TaxID=166423 RepID=A0A0M8ZN49_9HYME|nr:hypothetical protein WN51_08770 [Melipona quadrifasciata]
MEPSGIGARSVSRFFPSNFDIHSSHWFLNDIRRRKKKKKKKKWNEIEKNKAKKFFDRFAND